MIERVIKTCRFLRKPVVKKVVMSLPEEKIIGSLASLYGLVDNRADIIKGLQLVEQLRPEGGFKGLLSNEEFLDTLEEFLIEISSGSSEKQELKNNNANKGDVFV